LIGAAAAIAATFGLQWAGVLPAANSSDPAPLIAPVQAELAALKDEVAALKNAPVADLGPMAATLEKVQSDLAALQSRPVAEADPAASAALDARIKELEGRVSTAVNTAGGEDSRVAALEQSLSGLSAKLDQQASQPKVALAIAAAALKPALERGGAFTAELETLAALSPDAPELTTLRGYAQTGVATAADLSAEAGPAADAMISAATPVDPNAGILDRLMTSARSMVRVRPVGEVAGESVEARVARLEAAVGAGQYDRALAEYDALPEAAKAAGAAYAERIKARVEAAKLADQLVANAMKAA